MKTTLLGAGAVSCIVIALFLAARLPLMEVVRRNIQSGVDADAYFYSEIEDFAKHEKAVAEMGILKESEPGQ